MYGFTTTLTGMSFEQALAKTLAALKVEGFGMRRSAGVSGSLTGGSSIAVCD